MNELFETEIIRDAEIEETISLVIYGEPKPKQSMRHAYNHNKGYIQTFKDPKVAKAEQDIKNQVLTQYRGGVIEEPIAITKLHYIFSPLKSLPKYKKLAIERGEIIYKNTKPDLTDNLNKGLFDALEGIVIANDSAIVSMDDVKKYFGTKPRIELEMKILDPKYAK